MSLIDRFLKIFAPRQAHQDTTVDEMAVLNARRNDASMSLSSSLMADQERRAIVATSRKMYKTDPRARGIIKTLARDAVKGGFKVKVKNNPKAEQAANDLVQRLKLGSLLDDIVRLTLRDGDSFEQIGVTEERLITLLSRMPTLSMHRNSNEQDRFDDPTKAFWLAPENWYGGDKPPEDATFFAEWQIIHVRWDHDEGGRYGSPLFESATGAWKRMSEGELDIAVRRRTRAGMKFLHVLEGAQKEDIDAYKAENQDVLRNPFAAVADFFSNRPGSITAIQGDAQLGQIEDVLHHIRTFWVASPVPMSLLGYGQDLNRDVLEEQKAQYDRALAQVTQWVEDEIVRPLLERQWLLLGYLPESLAYEIAWQVKSTLTAADLRDVADAALRLQALGFPDEAIRTLIGQFLPGIDLESLMGAQPQSDSGRMADEADALLKQAEA